MGWGGRGGLWKSADPCYFFAQIRRSAAIFVQIRSALRKNVPWCRFIAVKGTEMFVFAT